MVVRKADGKIGGRYGVGESDRVLGMWYGIRRAIGGWEGIMRLGKPIGGYEGSIKGSSP